MIVAVLSFDIKQILKKRRNKDIRTPIKTVFLHISGLQKQEGTVKTNEMEPLEQEEGDEEEEHGEERENVDDEEEPPQQAKKKGAKRGPRGLWKQDLVDDLVDIVITNDYYKKKADFCKHQNSAKRKGLRKSAQRIEKQVRGQGEKRPFHCRPGAHEVQEMHKRM